MTKQCKKCKEKKDITCFGRTGYDKNIRNICKVCVNIQTRKRRKDHREQTILTDCAGSDSKHGRGKNDLTVAFIEKIIIRGCNYCGASELKMTLDRVNNKKAHNKRNVKACCIRCNYLKSSMPQKAWESLVSAVRKTYEAGLFKKWRSTSLIKPK